MNGKSIPNQGVKAMTIFIITQIYFVVSHLWRRISLLTFLGVVLAFGGVSKGWSAELPSEPSEALLVNEDVNIITGLYTREYSLTGAEVVDYKTDRVNEEQMAVRVEYYRPQIENYARVVAAQTGLAISEISRRLVFLSAGRVVNL